MLCYTVKKQEINKCNLNSKSVHVFEGINKFGSVIA